MFLLRANLPSVKPNAFVVGALQRPAAVSRRSIALIFCSGGRSMDDKQTPTEAPPDVMSSSFGEGYATRSDEEGFGGIYSDSQQLNKDRQEINDEKSPEKEFDKISQGSEVKEREKGRNQHEDNACN